MPDRASKRLAAVRVDTDEVGALAAIVVIASDAVVPGRLLVVADALVRRPPALQANLVCRHDFLPGLADRRSCRQVSDGGGETAPGVRSAVRQLLSLQITTAVLVRVGGGTLNFLELVSLCWVWKRTTKIRKRAREAAPNPSSP